MGESPPVFTARFSSSMAAAASVSSEEDITSTSISLPIGGGEKIRRLGSRGIGLGFYFGLNYGLRKDFITYHKFTTRPKNNNQSLLFKNIY